MTDPSCAYPSRSSSSRTSTTSSRSTVISIPTAYSSATASPIYCAPIPTIYRVCFLTIVHSLQAFSLPGSMYLSILGGAVWGVPALPLVCCLVATGATLCYLISAALGPVLLTFPKWQGKLDKWAQKIEQHSVRPSCGPLCAPDPHIYTRLGQHDSVSHCAANRASATALGAEHSVPACGHLDPRVLGLNCAGCARRQYYPLVERVAFVRESSSRTNQILPSENLWKRLVHLVVVTRESSTHQTDDLVLRLSPHIVAKFLWSCSHLRRRDDPSGIAVLVWTERKR